MRKSKTIKIDDKEITVKELRVKDIFSIFDSAGEVEGKSWAKQIQSFLPKFAAGLSFEDLKKMAPSEIMQIFNVAKEINSDFLHISRFLGLDKIMLGLKNAFMSDLSKLLAGSLEAGTQIFGNMDIPSLSSQQANTKKQEQNVSET